MTERLYYADSHRQDFTARVVECRPTDNGWAVVLDRTALFPEGGGQPGDTGTLNGVPVTDTREMDGEILHFVTAPIAAGASVSGALDWDRRFGLMQNHSGEHVVSGTANRLFGSENVGFHMSGGEVTIDLSTELTAGQLDRLEEEANRVVFENRAVRTYFPAPEVLEKLRYRSKREMTENVRLVEIEGCDLCACCAPHVNRTGEIGVIRLIGAMRHRGGMRLTAVCGKNALGDYRRMCRAAEEISAMLSVPRTETVRGVARQAEELERAKGETAALRRRLLEMKIDGMRTAEGNLVLFEPDLSGDDLRRLADAGADRCSGVCAVFGGADVGQYVIASRHVDLKPLAGQFNEAADGRGGGSSGMLRGSCRASEAVLRRAVAAVFGGAESYREREKL